MVDLSEKPLRECFYNVYSDKLDHQRASESFWSKYFHVWISEHFAFSTKILEKALNFFAFLLSNDECES